jgi:DnaJ-class molecular chaperone
MVTKHEDFYKILQVDPSADPEVIVAAYRRLAIKYHPDTSAVPDAGARMQRINQAYEVLSDPVARAVYDRSRRNQVAYEGARDTSRDAARDAARPANPPDDHRDNTQEAELERNRTVRAAEEAWKQAVRNADLARDQALHEAEVAWGRAKRAAEESWKRARRDADIERDRIVKEADDKWNRARRSAQAPARRTWSPSEP